MTFTRFSAVYNTIFNYVLILFFDDIAKVVITDNRIIALGIRRQRRGRTTELWIWWNKI